MNFFDTALQTHVDGCQKLIDKKGLTIPVTLKIKHGKRYVKIVNCENGQECSVFSFIDAKKGQTYGDVLKAASWSAPAKGARGNIFDEYNGLRRMSWTGPAYLR